MTQTTLREAWLSACRKEFHSRPKWTLSYLFILMLQSTALNLTQSDRTAFTPWQTCFHSYAALAVDHSEKWSNLLEVIDPQCLANGSYMNPVLVERFKHSRYDVVDVTLHCNSFACLLLKQADLSTPVPSCVPYVEPYITKEFSVLDVIFFTSTGSFWRVSLSTLANGMSQALLSRLIKQHTTYTH